MVSGTDSPRCFQGNAKVEANDLLVSVWLEGQFSRVFFFKLEIRTTGK